MNSDKPQEHQQQQLQTEPNESKSEEDSSSGLQQVMHMHRYGICPRCGGAMLLSSAQLMISTVSEGGWITSRLRESWYHTLICSKCRYKVEMEVKNCGLTPKGSEANSDRPPILKEERKLIGYVEKDAADSLE